MLTLRCFGSVAVEDDAGTERSLRSRKHLGLLLYLVATRRTTHTREDLADLLWSESGPRERHSLSQALYDIRSTVGHIVDATTNTVSLTARRIRFEGADFESAVETNDHEAALEMYRGEFAPNLVNIGADSFDRWLDGERERYRVLASIALRNAQRDAEFRGDWDRMCLAALRQIKANDLDEEAHAALMRGLWMKGDPASALSHYEALLRRASEDDWPQLEELAERIERSGTRTELLTVPRRPVSLVGREREFEELLSHVDSRRSRGLILVVGERGVGKTALLMEFARLLEVRGVRVEWLHSWPQRHLQNGAPIPGSVRIVDPLDALDPTPIQRTGIVEGIPTFLAIAPDALSEMEQIPFLGVVQIPRLAPCDVSRICATRYPQLSADAARVAGDLSGGNPHLALSLCAAIQHLSLDNRDVFSQPSLLATRAIAGFAPLSVVLDGWLQRLSESERLAAYIVAAVTDATRPFLNVLLGDQGYGPVLAKLRARGLCIDADDGTALAHPLMAHALRMRERQSERAMPRFVMDYLLRGGVRERAAAAWELAQHGEWDAALEQSLLAGTASLQAGELDTALQCARLALQGASVSSERVVARLLEAEAHLARGSPKDAEASLSRLLDVTLREDELLRVRVGLAHAALARGAVEEAQRHASAADNMQDRCPGRIHARVVIQHLRLTLDLALAEKDSARAHANAAALDRALYRERVRAAEMTPFWIDGLRSLLAYKMTWCSLAEASMLLRRFASTLGDLYEIGEMVLTTWRAVLEARAARLSSAETTLRSTMYGGVTIDGRPRSVALNNLAAVSLELGKWSEAHALLQTSLVADSELGLSDADIASTHLNLAQCALFASDVDRVRDHTVAAIRCTARAGLESREAQAWAIRGLMALEDGDRDGGNEAFERLKERHGGAPVEPDDYFVHWFLAASLARGDRAAAVDRLQCEAERLEAFDRLSAAKLAVLAAHYGGLGLNENSWVRGAARTLRAGGSEWFVRHVTGLVTN